MPIRHVWTPPPLPGKKKADDRYRRVLSCVRPVGAAETAEPVWPGETESAQPVLCSLPSGRRGAPWKSGGGVSQASAYRGDFRTSCRRRSAVRDRRQRDDSGVVEPNVVR
jgi:hypothetical protein